MQTPHTQILASTFDAPKNFQEFTARFPKYLPGYVRCRMPDASPSDQAEQVRKLEHRLLTPEDQISGYPGEQDPCRFFFYVNCRLLNN